MFGLHFKHHVLMIPGTPNLLQIIISTVNVIPQSFFSVVTTGSLVRVEVKYVWSEVLNENVILIAQNLKLG